jgi:AcrR family transcriptional regulator
VPRPNLSEDRRRELLPQVARAFAELGYRRATTAELAQRCGVRENVLYRLWPDKKAMFLAAIDHVYEVAMGAWDKVLRRGGEGTPAQQILAYESEHYGETGLYRLVFAGLSETDDPEVRAALRRMYGRFHAFLRDRVAEHRGGSGESAPDADVAAWAIVGIGTVSNLMRELRLVPAAERARLLREIGVLMLDPPARVEA